MDYKDLATSIASRHVLPAHIVLSMCAVESSWNPYAIRFEPLFFEKYIRSNVNVRPISPCSADTERQAQATSWGLMQIMGATARGIGFKGAFLASLIDPETGLDWSCRYLATLRDKHLGAFGWAGVVAAYNAGSPRKMANGKFANQEYVEKVRARCAGAWTDA